MAQPETAILAHDPDDKELYARDYTDWLTGSDTLSSVTVDVVEGTATVATTNGGAAGTSKPASLSGAVASIWVLSATAGKVGLRFRAVTTSGRQRDFTHYLQVGAL